MAIKEFSVDNDPKEPKYAPLIDVIAIHGLYENLYDTWTDSKTGNLWLRDILPWKRLTARVLAYGYDGENLLSPGSNSGDGTLPYAITLIAELAAHRQWSSTSERPIIFICHGFGGILLKRALAHSNSYRQQGDLHRGSIYTSTYAVLFMGTPHKGMQKSTLLHLRKGLNLEANQFVLNLIKDSEMLQDIDDQFSAFSKRFKTFHFWEEAETRFRYMQKSFVVNRDSAAPDWKVAERCGIRGNHSEMVKFRDPDDSGYRVILEALERYIKTAPELIKSRWMNEHKRVERDFRSEESIGTVASHRQTPPNGSKTRDFNDIFFVPRGSSTFFTGRVLHAKIVQEKLTAGDHLQTDEHHRIFVIFGLGGSGKTQFCLKYVEDNRDSYWGIFWIDASTNENAEAGFAYIGEHAGRGHNFAAGKHWLSECKKRWLLVIDNADDLDMDVARYFPAGKNGDILITTRNPSVTIHATVGQLRFSGMDPTEAVVLLLKFAGSSVDPKSSQLAKTKCAQDIVAELGFLALAVAHAGATIRRNIFTLEKYLNYYLKCRGKMLDNYSQIVTPYDANIISTWEIPFRRILAHQREEYKDAADLLRIFAFMHFETIPEEIFSRAWDFANRKGGVLPHWPLLLLQNRPYWDMHCQGRMKRALGILRDCSIIDHGANEGFCALHPVIHRWARDRLLLSEQREWLKCCTSIIASCISADLEFSGRKFRSLLLPHLDACIGNLSYHYPWFPDSLTQATEIEKFAAVYSENGLWKSASSLQRKVVDFRLKQLGWHHEDTIQAQIDLASSYWNLFEIKSAVELQTNVVRSRRWSRPSLADWMTWPPWLPSHISYCIALDDLGRTYWLAGRRDKSRYFGERAVHGLTKRLGKEDPLTLTAMFNLARTYLHLEKYNKCRELLNWVFDRQYCFFGPDHLDTLMTQNEIGICHWAQNEVEVAEILVFNVYESRRKILGKEHAYTFWSVNDLAKVINDCGRAEEAAKMLEDIIPMVSRTLGESHVGMTMTRANLARAYAKAGKWREVEQLLTLNIERIPLEHPDWIHAMNGIVKAQVQQERLEEAESNVKKILDILNLNKDFLQDSRTLKAAAQLLEIYKRQERSGDIKKLKRRVPTM